MARYANDDHGVMRVGLATWPAAKSPRKASAVRTMIAAVTLPKEFKFIDGSRIVAKLSRCF
jgi:hypothetical protein